MTPKEYLAYLEDKIKNEDNIWEYQHLLAMYEGARGMREAYLEYGRKKRAEYKARHPECEPWRKKHPQEYRDYQREYRREYRRKQRELSKVEQKIVADMDTIDRKEGLA